MPKRKGGKVVRLVLVKKAKPTYDLEKVLRELPTDLLLVVLRVCTEEVSERLENGGQD